MKQLSLSHLRFLEPGDQVLAGSRAKPRLIHPYYTVALAPPIGMGGVFLWAAVWSFILLGRSPAAFLPDMRLGVLVLGLLGASVIVTLYLTSRWTVVSIAALAIGAALAVPAAYAANTVANAPRRRHSLRWSSGYRR